MKKTIRVGLVGYGRAGQAVAKILRQSDNIDLQWIAKRQVDPLRPPVPGETHFIAASALEESTFFDEHPVDAIIDFSIASSIGKYGRQAAGRGITIISAVSKYPEAAKNLIEELSRQTAIMCSPNITLGINYLLVAAQLLQHIAPFTDIEIIEEHFRDKAERSGTALRIAEKLGLDDSKVNSIRIGGIVGRHEVIFGFPYQTIRLVHDSISREAFGTGALFALQRLHGRPPGLYTYESILREAMLEGLKAEAKAFPPAAD